MALCILDRDLDMRVPWCVGNGNVLALVCLFKKLWVLLRQGLGKVLPRSIDKISVVVQRRSVVCPGKNLQDRGVNPRSVNPCWLLSLGFVACVVSKTRIVPAGSGILPYRDWGWGVLDATTFRSFLSHSKSLPWWLQTLQEAMDKCRGIVATFPTPLFFHLGQERTVNCFPVVMWSEAGRNLQCSTTLKQKMIFLSNEALNAESLFKQFKNAIPLW